MEIKNPKYVTSDGQFIDVELNHQEFGWIPFTATETDVETNGREVFARCIAGEFGEILPYVAPPSPTDEELASLARFKRANMLALSDWTQLNDVPQETKSLWAPYRQALRDITEQQGFPVSID